MPAHRRSAVVPPSAADGPTVPSPRGPSTGGVKTTRFGHLLIQYDDRVLAPRDWTINQSYWAAQLLRLAPHGRLLELCSGVGHIGLFTASIEPRATVLVDHDPVACAFAEANLACASLRADVEVRRAELTTAVAESERFAVIIADPPWVPHSRVSRFPADPSAAIDGGYDGLEIARRCVTTIDRCLMPDGFAVVQLGTVGQAESLNEWIIGRPQVLLEPGALRSHEPHGVLLLLKRPGGGSEHHPRHAGPSEA